MMIVNKKCKKIAVAAILFRLLTLFPKGNWQCSGKTTELMDDVKSMEKHIGFAECCKSKAVRAAE